MTDLPLGWIDFHERTDEQNLIHDRIVGTLPVFGLVSEQPAVNTKVLLTNLWTKQEVKDALGFAFPGWHQFTGSCVGVGYGNGIQTLNFIDAFIRNELERIILAFWPYNYGRSRQLAGMNGPGEGSLGSTIAKSGSIDGTSDWIKTLGLPEVKNTDQLVIGKSQELVWSDGKHAPQAVRTEALPHKVTSAQLSSGAQVRDSIINGYPVLRAFGKFVNPGSTQVRSGVRIGTYNGSGGHQESWLGYWNHPQLGELIYEMNQWGQQVYGADPGGGALGGCWISLDDVDRQCRSQYSEIYALSQYDGYPAQPRFFDWIQRSFYV